MQNDSLMNLKIMENIIIIGLYQTEDKKLLL